MNLLEFLFFKIFDYSYRVFQYLQFKIWGLGSQTPDDYVCNFVVKTLRGRHVPLSLHLQYKLKGHVPPVSLVCPPIQII